MSSDVQEMDACSARLVNEDRVSHVRTQLPRARALEDLADVFSMLSDPGRLRLLVSLLEGGELCVCDLAATAGLSESATSHALRLLRSHDLVRSRRAGRMVHYSLADDHVRLLLGLALEHGRHVGQGS